MYIPKYYNYNLLCPSDKCRFHTNQSNILQQVKIITESHNRSKCREQLNTWCPAQLIQCSNCSGLRIIAEEMAERLQESEEALAAIAVHAYCPRLFCSLLRHPGEKILTVKNKGEGSGLGHFCRAGRSRRRRGSFSSASFCCPFCKCSQLQLPKMQDTVPDLRETD